MSELSQIYVTGISPKDATVLDSIRPVQGDSIAKKWENIRQTLRAFYMQSCPVVVPVDPAIRGWLDKCGVKITMTSMSLSTSKENGYYFYPAFTATGEMRMTSDIWPDVRYGFYGDEIGARLRDDITSCAVHMDIIPLEKKIHRYDRSTLPFFNENKKETARMYKPGEVISGYDTWKFVHRLYFLPKVDPYLFFGVVSATNPLAAPIPLRHWFSRNVEGGFVPLAQDFLAGMACTGNALNVTARLPEYIGIPIVEARKTPPCAEPRIENQPPPVRAPEPGDKRVSAGTQTDSPIPKKIKMVTAADVPVQDEPCAAPQMTDSECLARVCAIIGKDTTVAASRTQSPDRAAAIQRLAMVLHAFGDGTQSTVTAKKTIHGIFDAERKKQ
jgi:hypothetical protein